MEIDGHQVVRAAFARTVRLVTTARLRASVLEDLVEDKADLDALAEIEGATSARLTAEQRGLGALETQELVHDVPHAHFINASFAYANPQAINRFNGTDRGAWYAALSVETALAEVQFHLTSFLRAAGDLNAVVEYAEMFASLAGQFVDLRDAPEDLPCLHPDPDRGYPPGNILAVRVRREGLNGIIYPSVRDLSGTCIVALRPNAVQSVTQGGIYVLRWTGNDAPHIEGPLAD